MAAIISAQCAARVAPTVSGARKSAFSGKAVQARSVSLSAPRAAKLTVRAADAPAKAEKKEKKEEEKPWTPPKLNPNTPSPIFGGSTGGLLRKAQVRRASVTREISLSGQAHPPARRARPDYPPDRARSAAELGSTRGTDPFTTRRGRLRAARPAARSWRRAPSPEPEVARRPIVVNSNADTPRTGL